ncbi:hypothetical protein D9758_000184 [Tetrapyrgos nigripes]|uniref:Prephenate dehydratase domain-containing protein n=1 Tax=Tetrapyrgos nigripes TaxID=182062 RepID=A0A8H5LZ13_9AGAR|nr:hypothetical protein D9758_000184 [Tetrapyrgos nigripes]
MTKITHYSPVVIDVVESLSDLDCAVVPQENTIFGSVVETYNALRILQHGFIRGEITLEIQHCLVTRKGVGLSDIDCVMSHEQALGQCRGFLSKHLPNASRKKMDSTAAAAEALLRSPDGLKSAAICSKVCVTMFEGLQMLYEGIQDEKINFTRFYVLAKNHCTKLPQLPAPCTHALFRITRISTDSPKMSIIFEALEIDMEVTRVDRRPKVSNIPFQDVHFIEVKRSTNEDSHWTQSVDCATGRIQSMGVEAQVLGIW